MEGLLAGVFSKGIAEAVRKDFVFAWRMLHTSQEHHGDSGLFENITIFDVLKHENILKQAGNLAIRMMRGNENLGTVYSKG